MSGTAYQRKGARAAAQQATRERILAAAEAAFGARWYDDVTLREVAHDAGVALQTVVNHFGTKEALFLEVGERIGESIGEVRWSVPAGDLDRALRVLLEDYERRGDMMVRNLALEAKVPVTRPMIEVGRREHERWVQHCFPAALEGLSGAARRRRIAQLVAVTDVYTWKLLRRDKGLGPAQVLTAVRELVLALHPTTEQGEAP